MIVQSAHDGLPRKWQVFMNAHDIAVIHMKSWFWNSHIWPAAAAVHEGPRRLSTLEMMGFTVMIVQSAHVGVSRKRKVFMNAHDVANINMNSWLSDSLVWSRESSVKSLSGKHFLDRSTTTSVLRGWWLQVCQTIAQNVAYQLKWLENMTYTVHAWLKCLKNASVFLQFRTPWYRSYFSDRVFFGSSFEFDGYK
jgi:hypothetical protein